jgi:hypothetical protein
MVIDSAVKSKVIHLWTYGCGRNQIVRELANQGVKISTTTVTNLIRQHQAHFKGPLLSYLLGEDNSTDFFLTGLGDISDNGISNSTLH